MVFGHLFLPHGRAGRSQNADEMSALLSDDLLIALGTSGEVPLHVRVLALGCWRADSSGQARWAEDELSYLLRHPSEVESRQRSSTDRAISKAAAAGFVGDDSTADLLIMSAARIKIVRSRASAG